MKDRRQNSEVRIQKAETGKKDGVDSDSWLLSSEFY
jgi:hypothetical protein